MENSTKDIGQYEDFDDLSELCTGSQEKDGIWVDVDLYGKKMNLRALIYGETSDDVRKAAQEKLRSQMKSLNIQKSRGRVDFDEEKLGDILSDDGVGMALIRLGGLSKRDGTPLKFQGKDVPVKKEGAEAIYEGILRGMPELSDFVMAVAKDRSSFLPEKKKS